MDVRKIRMNRPKPKQSTLSRSGLCSHDYNIPIIINEEVPSQSYMKSSIDALKKEITTLKIRLERRNIKLSKIAET